MKSFLRILLLSLVLIIVALISALTSMRFAIHGRQVAVPKLVGLSPEEATRVVEGQGLSLKVDRQFFSPTVTAGKVVSQTPDAGAKVRRGWRVLVAESLGPVRVAPPDAVGQSERAAVINIKRRGLQVGEEAVLAIPGQDAGMVIAQNPPANSTSVTSPNVSLLVTASASPQAYVMVSFLGASLAAATEALKDARMRVGSVTAIPADDQAASQPLPIGPASIVMAQTPAPGQRVQEGQAVNFDVKP
jgi:beta-lactam-binding protein with PASTA domain